MTSADSDDLSNSEELKKFLQNSKTFLDKLDDSYLGAEERKTKKELLEFFHDDGYYTRMYPSLNENEDDDDDAEDYDTIFVNEDEDEGPKKPSRAQTERADELTGLSSINGYLTVKTGWFSWEKFYALVYDSYLYLYPKIHSEKPKVKYFLTGGQYKVNRLKLNKCYKDQKLFFTISAWKKRQR